MGGGGGKGGGGGYGGDLRQVPGPWRMPTSWGTSPSSGVVGAFPAGPQVAAAGGTGGMSGYPGAPPWGGGQPFPPAMQGQGMAAVPVRPQQPGFGIGAAPQGFPGAAGAAPPWASYGSGGLY